MAKIGYKKMLGRMFLPISRRDALRIASNALTINTRGVPLICHGTKPPACWYIYLPWNDNKDVTAIRGSRVMLVSKLTSMIHYDGSAGDEG